MFKAGNGIDDDSDDDIDVTAAAADDVDANHLVDNNIGVIEVEANSRNLILYEIITPSSYIGLRSPPESLESSLLPGWFPKMLPQNTSKI